jgi:uncharacterized protein YPO0396
MDLFTKFDFQLLLITPLEGKARLPLPFVKSYHSISNPTYKASSITRVSVEAIELMERGSPANR